MVNNEAVQKLVAENPGIGDALANLMAVPLVEARDISNAIAFLVSDAGRYITGVTLPVDAGFTIR